MDNGRPGFEPLPQAVDAAPRLRHALLREVIEPKDVLKRATSQVLVCLCLILGSSIKRVFDSSKMKSNLQKNGISAHPISMEIRFPLGLKTDAAYPTFWSPGLVLVIVGVVLVKFHLGIQRLLQLMRRQRQHVADLTEHSPHRSCIHLEARVAALAIQIHAVHVALDDVLARAHNVNPVFLPQRPEGLRRPRRRKHAAL